MVRGEHTKQRILSLDKILLICLRKRTQLFWVQIIFETETQ